MSATRPRTEFQRLRHDDDRLKQNFTELEENVERLEAENERLQLAYHNLQIEDVRLHTTHADIYIAMKRREHEDAAFRVVLAIAKADRSIIPTPFNTQSSIDPPTHQYDHHAAQPTQQHGINCYWRGVKEGIIYPCTNIVQDTSSRYQASGELKMTRNPDGTEGRPVQWQEGEE